MAESKPDTNKEKSNNIIFRTLRRVFQVFRWLIATLFFSIAIEWILISTVWSEEGVNHSARMVQQEMGYLHEDFVRDKVYFGTSAYHFVESLSGRLYKKTMIDTGIDGFFSGFSASTPIQTVIVYGRTMLNIIELFYIKLIISLLALPFFLLMGAWGILEGLIRRDLRKWHVSDESSFLYHHAKFFAVPLLVTAPIIYLSLPFSIHPTLIFVPFAIGFAISLMVMFDRLMKWL